jgi:hypothetical protein
MGGCPQEWRTEVSQLGTVTPCWTFIPPDAHRSTEVSAWNSVRTGSARPCPVGL